VAGAEVGPFVGVVVIGDAVGVPTGTVMIVTGDSEGLFVGEVVPVPTTGGSTGGKVSVATGAAVLPTRQTSTRPTKYSLP
jgi:hypothetical protein